MDQTISTSAGVREDQRNYINIRSEPPQEPALLLRANELLGYLNQLEGLQRETRVKLLGRVPSCASDDDSRRPDERCLDELLATACAMAAMLVGEQKTILARI
jgi:hypothetical protein